MMSALRDLGKLKHRTRSMSNESPISTEMNSQSSNSKGMNEDTSNDSDQNMSHEKPPTPDIQNTDNTVKSSSQVNNNLRSDINKRRSLATSTHSLVPPGGNYPDTENLAGSNPAASNPAGTHNQNISSLASLCNRSEMMDTAVYDSKNMIDAGENMNFKSILNVTHQECLTRTDGLIQVRVTNYDGKITNQIMTEEEFSRALKKVQGLGKPRSRSLESRPRLKHSPTENIENFRIPLNLQTIVNFSKFSVLDLNFLVDLKKTTLHS